LAGWKALLEFIETLKGIPETVVPSDHIGMKIPAGSSELPALVASLGEMEESPIGIGGMAGTRRTPDESWSESRGKKGTGILFAEIWAGDENKVMEVAHALFQILETQAEILRGKGFIRFGHRDVKPMETVNIGGQAAKRMVTSYSVIFEEVQTETTGPGGIIRRIHVDLDHALGEEMDIS
jgi:hypothetical protein